MAVAARPSRLRPAPPPTGATRGSRLAARVIVTAGRPTSRIVRLALAVTVTPVARDDTWRVIRTRHVLAASARAGSGVDYLASGPAATPTDTMLSAGEEGLRRRVRVGSRDLRQVAGRAPAFCCGAGWPAEVVAVVAVASSCHGCWRWGA